MNTFRTFLIVIVFSGLTALQAFASGSYAPGGRGPGDANYNRGKALVSSPLADGKSCKDCHSDSKRFRRKHLKEIKSSVSSLLTSCDTHTPCYDDLLNDDNRVAMDAYFSKRYRLK